MKSYNQDEELWREKWASLNAELAEAEKALSNPKVVTMSARMKIAKIEERIENLKRTAAKLSINLGE